MYYNQLKTLFDDPSTSANEKQSQRVQGLTEPLHVELVAQLLDNLESEEPAEELAFVSNNNNKGAKPGFKDSKVPLACFSKAIDGECKRDNCTYSHDPSVLSAYLQDTLQMILRANTIRSLRPSLLQFFSDHLRSTALSLKVISLISQLVMT